MRNVLLACALVCVAACGGSDENQQPAQYPETTASPTLTGAPTAITPSEPTAITPSAPDPNGAPATGTADSAMSNSWQPSDTAAHGPANPAANGQPSIGGSNGQSPTYVNAGAGAETPIHGSQSQTPAEMKITEAARATINKDASLSAMAKNITIVTSGTKVTLTGTVKSDAEKKAVEKRVKKIHGVSDVDNQLDVQK